MPTSQWRTVHVLDTNPLVPKPQFGAGPLTTVGRSEKVVSVGAVAGRGDRGVGMVKLALRIIGRRLPGSSWSGRHGIHVGVQEDTNIVGLVDGDAGEAVFDVELDMVEAGEGELDFRGPYVNGKRGERFVYLVWGEMDGDGAFAIFKRLKLHLAPLVEQYTAPTVLAAKRVQAVLELTDTRGRPLAASVRPPWVTWRLGAGSR